MSLHLLGLYCGCVEGLSDNRPMQWFREAWAKSGKRLNMGRPCIRFKKVDGLALDVLGEAIRHLPAKKYIEAYEKTRG